MMQRLRAPAGVCAWLAVLFIMPGRVFADGPPVTREQFLLLQQQNEILQQQVRKQQEVIDALSRKVDAIENANAHYNRELQDLKDAGADSKPEVQTVSTGGEGFHIGKVDIAGEGGVAFFESQNHGATRNAEFRIDEARLFLEAPVWKNVSFYTEINLAEREEPDLNVRVGELYLEVEDLSELWGSEHMMSLRLGRFYIPFGEEYQYRFAIDNPLISHSVSDLWGVDEGVEAFGRIGPVQYVLAVQNGGDPTTRDFNSDKAVVGRIGGDPTAWLHVSVSGMRTGELATMGDSLSALWFGNGWIRSVGSPQTTVFHANLVEGDVRVHVKNFALNAAGGYINYGDNDPLMSNDRDVYYYYVEGVQELTRKLYCAARFSQVLARNGFPIVGNGDMATYFMQELTSDYWRLSLGLGYHFSPNLLVKGEYSFNQGQDAEGDRRGHEDQFALEAAFRF